MDATPTDEQMAAGPITKDGKLAAWLLHEADDVHEGIRVALRMGESSDDVSDAVERESNLRQAAARLSSLTPPKEVVEAARRIRGRCRELEQWAEDHDVRSVHRLARAIFADLALTQPERHP